MILPWMGKSRWAPLQSTRLISVFAAGILVLIGFQTNACASPALKPHRLERTSQPQAAIPSSARASTGSDSQLLVRFLHQHIHHDGMPSFSPVDPLIIGDAQSRIGWKEDRASVHGSVISGIVSPRGPPSTHL